MRTNEPAIRNHNPAMAYRRFGKTEKTLSVITLGGMRYIHGWEDPRDDIPRDMIDQCTTCVQLALKHGINHIETAKGYGKSETCYGIVLNKELGIPRNSYYLMTKGAPETGDETRAAVEGQLKALQTDYLDFYGWHGINNRERREVACARGGPVEALLKLKEEGLIGSVGFSSHAIDRTNVDAIETGLFDFVNMHYYYFQQRNLPAVEAAAQRDMGVFIISPNDKGGRLFNAPDTLREVTAPRTPIQWNARFCLKTPMVHTLSFGMTEPSHFEEMAGVCEGGLEWNEHDQKTLDTLGSMLSRDPYASYDGSEIPENDSGLNIREILRFRKMWKCYDMEDWCSYRYNMFEEKGHWFPGGYATDENIAKIPEEMIPPDIPLKDMLREFHRKFYKEKQ